MGQLLTRKLSQFCLAVELQAEQSFHVGVDGIDRAIAVDALQQALALVIVDKRTRALGVDVEAIANRGLVVVVALIHLAVAFRAGGIGSGADVAAFFAAATLGEALDDNLRVNVDEQRCVERALEAGQHVVEGHSLSRGAREAVENEALLAVGLAQALVHEVDDQAIGNQIARIHVALGLLAELGLVLHRGAQNVARGNVRRGEFLNQLGGLRTLAGARGAQQHDIHS